MLFPPTVTSALAPKGVLRVGVNMSNFLLVSSRGPRGEPRGVVPDLAERLASDLDLQLELHLFPNPGALGDAVDSDVWDVAFLGSEPARAATIAFTQPYAEIEATYLVPAGSRLSSVAEVDAPGVRVAVSQRAAYECWLTDNLRRATLLRTAEPGLALSRELFLREGCDALAGLRPWLLTQAESLEGATVLDGRFSSVQQAVGVPRSRADGGATMHLERWVEEQKASGLVASLIEEHGVRGKLTVAERCTTR